MDIPSSALNGMDWGNRTKRAALGFGVTVAPVLALASAEILLAPNMVENAGFDLDTDSWVISQFRTAVVFGYAWIVAAVFTYWMFALSFGRGEILGIKSANVTLVGSVLSFAFAVLIASVVPDPSQRLKWTCPLIGIPDTMPALPSGTYGFDVQTSCEAFSNRASPIVLLGLPLALLVASGVLRIVVSRRRWRHSVR